MRHHAAGGPPLLSALLCLTGLAAAVAWLRPGTALAGLLWAAPLVLGILQQAEEGDDKPGRQTGHRRETLKGLHALFDSFVDASPVAVEVYDRTGALLRSNKAAERLLGKVPPPGLSLFEERGLKRAGLLEPQLKRVLAGTRVETPATWYDPTEIGIPGVPGRKVCFRATVFPLLDEGGNVMRIAVMHEDLTEHRKLEQDLKTAREEATGPRTEARPLSDDIREVEFRRRKVEQTLRETEERYLALVRDARDFAVIRTADDGRVLAISPSVEAIWGLSAEAIQTDPAVFFGQVHRDDLESVRAVEARFLESGTPPAAYRFRVCNAKTGKLHWVQASGSVCSAMGRRTHDRVLFDVTRQVEAEQALAAGRTDVAAIAASPTEGVVTVGPDLVVRTWSGGAERETRVAAQQTVGQPLARACPALGVPQFITALRRAAESREVLHEANVQLGPTADSYRVTVFPHGPGLLLLIRNTTAQRKIEQAWRDADTRLKALLDVPGVAVLVKDRTLRCTAANAAALRMLGVGDASAIIGKTDAEFLKPTVAGLIGSHDRRVLEEGKPVEVELALPDLVSAGAGWYRMVKCPLRSLSGEITGILDVAHDVTRQVHARQELARRRSYLEELVREQASALERSRKELERWSGRPGSGERD